MGDLRTPGRFVWERSGRQYVTRFGRFTASVVMDGSQAKGTLRFRTGDIFGNPFIGSREWKTCDDAILEAEPLIIIAADELWSAMKVRRKWRVTAPVATTTEKEGTDE
jgi:hypothetical protein